MEVCLRKGPYAFLSQQTPPQQSPSSNPQSRNIVEVVAKFVNENNLTITWTASTAGKETISSGNDIGTPATGTVHMEVGDSAGFGGLKSGTTWTITHNQNQRFCNFEIVDSSHNVIDGIYSQPVVTMIDVNTASVVWPTATTGYVDLIKSNFASGLQSSANVWTVTHNLGQQYPNIDVLKHNSPIV